MKILCACNGGNCRSPVLAEVLKGTFGHDAIAIGTFWASDETMAMLCHWADLIVPVESRDTPHLPAEDMRRWRRSPIWENAWHDKVRIAKIGPDIWGHGKYEELKRVCLEAAKEILQSLRA